LAYPTLELEHDMNLTRIVFLALAVLLPSAWTSARANEEVTASDKTEKTTKKSKKSKKADGTEETHTTETKTEKKAE